VKLPNINANHTFIHVFSAQLKEVQKNIWSNAQFYQRSSCRKKSMTLCAGTIAVESKKSWLVTR